MTWDEIQSSCLSLPEPERVALAGKLVESLDDTEGIERLRRQVEAQEAAKMEGLRKKLDAEMTSWFEEGSEELTEEGWRQIFSDEVTEEELDKPLGTGVPREWTGRTLRELRATRQE